jgi:co-chaperonin GroES (HSP10)
MRAVGDSVFILPDWDNEEKSAGGIHLPKVRIRDLPFAGTVKAVAENPTCDFKVGDRVIYDKHKSQMVNVPGEPLTLVMVKIQDVMAVYETKKTNPKKETSED